MSYASLAETGLPTLLKDYLSNPADPSTAAAHDAAFRAVKAMTRDEPELCWRFLELAADLGLGDLETAYLAAGPLEDLLGRHGGRMRERVETAARRNEGVRRMLGGVWQGDMSSDDWAWFQDLRHRLRVAPL
jgi:hypothetical protein